MAYGVPPAELMRRLTATEYDELMALALLRRREAEQAGLADRALDGLAAIKRGG